MGGLAAALLAAAVAAVLGAYWVQRQSQRDQLTRAIADLDHEFASLTARGSWTHAEAAARQRVGLAPELATPDAYCRHADAIRMARQPGWQAAELAALESAADAAAGTTLEGPLARLTLIRLMRREARHTEAVFHYNKMPVPLRSLKCEPLALPVATWLEQQDERNGGGGGGPVSRLHSNWAESLRQLGQYEDARTVITRGARIRLARADLQRPNNAPPCPLQHPSALPVLGSSTCLECLAAEGAPRLLRSAWSIEISTALTPDALLQEAAETDTWNVLQCNHRFFVDAYPRRDRPGRTFSDFATAHSSQPDSSSGGETVTTMTIAELFRRCHQHDATGDTPKDNLEKHSPPYYHVSEHLEALAPKLFKKLSSAFDQSGAEREVSSISDGAGELTRRMVVQEPNVEHPWTHNAGPVLRIGNKGSGHQAHYDLKHNVFLQLTGHKRFSLFPVSCARRLYLYPGRHALYRKSQVDFDTSANATLFPDFPPLRTSISSDAVDDCTPVHVDLGPGDMLYLPPMVVHHVEALSELTMGYNVFSASTVSEGVGELSELAKIPLVHELVPLRDRRGGYLATDGDSISKDDSMVATPGTASKDVPPDGMVAAGWLTQRCLLRLVSTAMVRYSWAATQLDWEPCSAFASTSATILSNSAASECKAKHFVREFLTRRYAPLAREGVEIWTHEDAVTLYRGYCSTEAGGQLNEGSWWESRAAEQFVSEVSGATSGTASAEQLRSSWDATCDLRTEGVIALLDGLKDSSAGLNAVEVALQSYLEEQAWHLVGLKKIQPFLLACLAS